VPEEFVDEGVLFGPRERIRQRFQVLADSGVTQLSIRRFDDETLEVMSKVAAG
jgi:hypothetical protein